MGTVWRKDEDHTTPDFVETYVSREDVYIRRPDGTISCIGAV